TTTKIQEIAYTKTYTFAADGTYTYSETTEYLAGADGDYRATQTENVTTASTIYTTTSYSGADYSNVGSYDAVLAGRAGKTISTSSSEGTWDRITRQDSFGDSITWEYYLTETSPSSSSSTILTHTDSEDADEIEGTSNTNKVTYKTLYTTNTVNAISDEPYSLGDVYWVRDDADGNDVVYIDEDLYTVQPQQ
ncbi:MAG TPA: hypothetical protein P5286_11935, partial [Treponemataceae bacterium]|nr:hypothetical protein [Treponemataceae bacterium]